MTLKFSIVTCTWNSEPYIQKCIESVRAQDYLNIEHVFVDGGSTDGTLERIASEAPNAVCLHNVRGGISRAMNQGARAATGDVIAHLHGDDYYLDSEVLSEVARAMSGGTTMWAFGRIKSVIGTDEVEATWAMPQFSYARLLRGNFIPHPATFVRRSLFEEAGGFDESLRYAMDYDLWLRIAQANFPVYIPRYLAGFRRHAGSTSTANAMAALEEDYAIRRRVSGTGLVLRSSNHIRYLWRRHKMANRLRNGAPLGT